MKKLFSLLPAAALLLCLCGCAGSLTRYQTTYLDVFDTVTTVAGYAASQEAFDAEAEKIHSLLLEYHELYDIYNDYDGLNNLRTVNENAGKSPVKVDARILDLLNFAREMYDKTGGKVNVAMGSVLTLWHDAREYGIANPDSAYLPDADALRAAAEHTDIGDVVVDADASTVYLSDPEMSLDVGAVAKGWAAGAAAQAVKDDGLTGWLLSVGGNVCAVGPKSGGSKWQVGIRDPSSESASSYILKVGAADLCVVTSGSYERYYTVNGVRYHHIIDPDTLYPNNTFSSVTVLSADSALADALTTALFNMDESAGSALIESTSGAEALWIRADGTQVFSSGFKNYVVK